MTREGVEIAIQVLHVDLQMRSTLRTVHQERHAVAMGRTDHFLDGVHRAQHIAHLCATHQFCLFGKEPFIFVEFQYAVVGHGNHAQYDAALLGLQLPRHDVGMVFHCRDNHLVAGLHLRLAERLRHKVDALRGASRKHDFLHFPCIHKLAHLLAGLLMQVGGTLRQEMHAAMHVGIHVVVFIHQCLHHLTRFLRGGSIVEIDKRFAVNLT